RLLGNVRLSHVRRSMARAALQRRLNWRLGRLARRVEETPRVKTLTLAVPGWPGHAAGQHVDVRLTAPDGYHTERSYSIASPPEDANQLELAIERLEGGEVSPYLVDQLAVGDELEFRGPIGGYFIWTVDIGGPFCWSPGDPVLLRSWRWCVIAPHVGAGCRRACCTRPARSTKRSTDQSLTSWPRAVMVSRCFTR